MAMVCRERNLTIIPASSMYWRFSLDVQKSSTAGRGRGRGRDDVEDPASVARKIYDYSYDYSLLPVFFYLIALLGVLSTLCLAINVHSNDDASHIHRPSNGSQSTNLRTSAVLPASTLIRVFLLQSSAVRPV